MVIYYKNELFVLQNKLLNTHHINQLLWEHLRTALLFPTIGKF